MKKITTYIFKICRRFYVTIFARPCMQYWNDLILTLALHGRGYNNCCSFKATGEEIFFSYLSKLNPKICIDIGANKGAYSKKLLTTTGAIVYAFEPLPKAYKNLLDLQKQFPSRFIPFNLGLGNKEEFLDIFHGDGDSELASFSKEIQEIDFLSSQNINSCNVQVTSLDNFFKKFNLNFQVIDLIKIDTEGFEYEVLQGSMGVIEKFKPKFIQIEFNRHQLFRGHSIYLFSTMLPNYSLFQILPHGKGIVKRDPKMSETNIYSYSNFIFVRSDIMNE